MRIVFAGSGSFGMPTLRALVEGGQEIVLTITQPDRPSGRGQVVRMGPVKSFARERNVPMLQPEDVNTPAVLRKIKSLRPDILLVIAYGQKIGPELLEMPRYGAINLHASLLPKYRGAAPINWAILNAEAEAGLTVMSMTPEIDAGDILGQRSVAIEPNETAGELHERLAKLGSRLISEVVREVVLEEVVRRHQNESQVTQAPRLKKSDGAIDWARPGQEVHNRIRGTTPWPGAFTFMDGGDKKAAVRIVVDRSLLVQPTGGKGEPGEIVAVGPEGIDVATKSGIVRLLELTPAGKRPMKSADFVNGHHVKVGMKFKEQA
jgi:methionyl-tRNA formyltransferase